MPGPSITGGDLVPITGTDTPPLDAADLSVEIYLGWSPSEQRVYVAVDRRDD
ncbi:MAG: hypothetical protein AB1505_14360 [Candidatus Latescibacterota bacterium]